MNILIFLLVPALYALSNTVDKFLVHGDDIDSEPGSIIAVTGLFNLLVAIPLGLWIYFTGRSIGLETLLPLMVNSITWLGMLWLYLQVLREEEMSRAVPWFQSIPIFGMILGSVTLHEMSKPLVVFAIIILVIGSFILSFKNGGMKKKMVILMLVASALVAVHDVIFAKFGREVDDVSAIFAETVGFAFWGLIILVGKKERKGFVLGLRTKFKLQAITEVITILALTLNAYAKLHVPVAVVQAGCATQPVFVLGFALLFAKFFPKVFSQEQGGSLWQKSVGIGLVTIGGLILAIST